MKVCRCSFLHIWLLTALCGFGDISSSRFFVDSDESDLNILKQGQSSSLKWKNCDGKDAPIQFQEMSIRPDPVILPGVFQLSLQFSVNRTLFSPIKFQARAHKQIAIWVPVPCLDELGYCELPDFCAVLPFVCPPVFRQHGLPCQCPIPKGNYSFPPANLTVSPDDLPLWVTEAPYIMEYRLTSGTDSIGCLHLQFSTLDP